MHAFTARSRTMHAYTGIKFYFSWLHFFQTLKLFCFVLASFQIVSEWADFLFKSLTTMTLYMHFVIICITSSGEGAQTGGWVPSERRWEKCGPSSKFSADREVAFQKPIIMRHRENAAARVRKYMLQAVTKSRVTVPHQSKNAWRRNSTKNFIVVLLPTWSRISC